MPNPFAHFELNTGNVAAAKKFYAALFNWKISDMPGMDYTMIDVGTKDSGGGMQKKMDGAPSAWLPYVAVESVKATLAKAQKAGARIELPYQPIGEMGAIGIFTDPTGATLGVWESKKGPAADAERKAMQAAGKKAAKPAKKVAKPAKKVAAKPAKKPAKKAAKKK
jgi:hypothetical protein